MATAIAILICTYAGAGDKPAPPPAKQPGLTAAIFSDHMVLQRQAKVPVWGTTTPGGTVTVTFMGQTKTAAADARGKWMVKLDEMPAEPNPQEMTIKDSSRTITFRDLLVGDVWLGSGQSNMGFGLTFSDEFKARRDAKENAPERAEDPDYMSGCVDGETMKVLRRAIGNPMIRVSSKTRDHLIGLSHFPKAPFQPADERSGASRPGGMDRQCPITQW